MVFETFPSDDSQSPQSRSSPFTYVKIDPLGTTGPQSLSWYHISRSEVAFMFNSLYLTRIYIRDVESWTLPTRTEVFLGQSLTHIPTKERRDQNSLELSYPSMSEESRSHLTNEIHTVPRSSMTTKNVFFLI